MVVGSLTAGVVGSMLVLPQLGRSVPAVAVDGLIGNAERGAYLATAAGCLTCHTDFKNKGQLLAGGAAIKTKFGTFYGPNITPHRTHGIGGWTNDEFSKALTVGIGPGGKQYFPSFPYTSYASMQPQDLVDIKSYLDTVTPVASPSRPHDLVWPFSDRSAVGAWKFLNFKPDPANAESRGAYLVNVLGHCGECHTQRNWLGGKRGVPLAGNRDGPGGEKVPGLRALSTDGAPWTMADIRLALQLGMKPNGDFLGSTMAEVVEHSTGKLSDEDRTAMAMYILSLK